MIEKEEKSAQNEQKTVKNEPFFIVPSKVFDLGLTPYEFSVLCYLIMRSDNDTHSCFPSEKGIASACGMGKTSVAKSLKSLEDLGIIEKEKRYQQSKNGLMRQTTNNYVIKCAGSGSSRTSTPTDEVRDKGDTAEQLPLSHMNSPRDMGDVAMRESLYHETTPPIPPRDREINKTIPNITKPNITKSTELSLDAAVDLEKERFSFMELKRGCFENLKNEKGIDEEYILLLDRALEHLWYKNNAEYEGRKYAQDELRAMLKDKVTPAILGASVEFLEHSKEPIRSPIPYLAKCILGGLVKGFLEYKKPNDDGKNPFASIIKAPESPSNSSSFAVNDFFAQALKNTYGDDFKF